MLGSLAHPLISVTLTPPEGRPTPLISVPYVATLGLPLVGRLSPRSIILLRRRLRTPRGILQTAGMLTDLTMVPVLMP